MKKEFPATFLWFLLGWLLLNILQSAFTGVIYDEAYYWYYSQNMAWGYFDHPPMVAVLIKLSSFFFNGELGVRFMSTLLSAGTAMLLWKLIEDKTKKNYIAHFFLLLFSMVLFNAYGFLTLPDTPLLFFTALFLWVYKGYLNKPSWPLAIALGLLMAALMYSKYHAVLVIVFVILSNLRLLLDPKAWVAVLIALLAYFPHLNWLYLNDFVTIKYHIYERPNHPYTFTGFTLGYILNLIANFGLLFPFFYWALFKTKPRDKFTKALVFLAYGVIGFFFVSTFQKRSQAQWVIVLCIPLFILTYTYLLQNAKSRKWMVRLGIVSMVLLFYARAWLIYQPLFPPKVFETHSKEWTQKLETIVGDTPVVFENSYRRAPMYSFYTGNQSFSLNNIHYRRNQYSIDSSEANIQHKKIAYVTYYANSGDFSYKPIGKNSRVFWGKYIDDFTSYRKLHCFIETEEVSLNKKNQILKIYNPYNQDIALSHIKLNVAYLNDYKQLKETKPLAYEPKLNGTTFLKAKDTTQFIINFPKPKEDNLSFIRFSIAEHNLLTGINSESIPIKK